MKITKYEVYFKMKNHYVWFKETETNEENFAIKLAKELQEKCKCEVQVWKIEKEQNIIFEKDTQS